MRLLNLLFAGVCFSAPVANVMLHVSLCFGWHPNRGELDLDEIVLVILPIPAGISLAWHAQQDA